MKENSNFNKIKNKFEQNGGYITRKEINEARIPSWFLSDFVRKNSLIKVSPGYYVSNTYLVDDYYFLQKRYPKYIFSGMSALYLLHMTDKIPTDIEVVAPQGYNPSRHKIDNLQIRKISDKEIYNLGIIEVENMFGNLVRVYDEERTICDLIKYRNKYDGETFIKALKTYKRKSNNQIKLFKYAKIMGIEKKVYEIMEVINNED